MGALLEELEAVLWPREHAPAPTPLAGHHVDAATCR
jgi:hypothetical protein